MRLYLRNKATGEIRDVEADSAEFEKMKREVISNGLPMWEQTSLPHADAIKERAKYGELLEEDLGHEDQDNLRFAALELDSAGVAPEVNPHLMLTPGEIEQGLTPEQKLADLKDQYHTAKYGHRTAIMEAAADRISDERAQRQATPTKQTSARAGGSDDRTDAPNPGDGRGGASNDEDLLDDSTDGGDSKTFGGDPGGNDTNAGGN